MSHLNTQVVRTNTSAALLSAIKVKCMASVLGLSFEKVVTELPKDDSGRILDYKTRHLIHDTLIENS
jgi:hypothetical protein